MFYGIIFWNRIVFWYHNFIYTRCEIICCLRIGMSKSVSVSFLKGDIISHGDLDNLRVIRIILHKDQKQPCRVSTNFRIKCIIKFVFKQEVAPHKNDCIKWNCNLDNICFMTIEWKKGPYMISFSIFFNSYQFYNCTITKDLKINI